MGRIYLRLNGKVYKLTSIKAGKDNSIYLATSLGPLYKGRGGDGHKFTYHPDGKSWMTQDMTTKNFSNTTGPDLPNKGTGLAKSLPRYKNNKVYSKDFEVNLPLTEVTTIQHIKFGHSYYDLRTFNADDMLARATNQKKTDGATIVDGRQYKHLTLRFFLVGKPYLNAGLAQITAKEKYFFEHPRLGIYVVVAIFDRWLGEKNDTK